MAGPATMRGIGSRCGRPASPLTIPGGKGTGWIMPAACEMAAFIWKTMASSTNSRRQAPGWNGPATREITVRASKSPPCLEIRESNIYSTLVVEPPYDHQSLRGQARHAGIAGQYSEADHRLLYPDPGRSGEGRASPVRHVGPSGFFPPHLFQ